MGPRRRSPGRSAVEDVRRDLAEFMCAGFWSAPGSTRSGLRSCRERVRAATYRQLNAHLAQHISRRRPARTKGATAPRGAQALRAFASTISRIYWNRPRRARRDTQTRATRCGAQRLAFPSGSSAAPPAAGESCKSCMILCLEIVFWSCRVGQPRWMSRFGVQGEKNRVGAGARRAVQRRRENCYHAELGARRRRSEFQISAHLRCLCCVRNQDNIERQQRTVQRHYANGRPDSDVTGSRRRQLVGAVVTGQTRPRSAR